MAKPARAVLIHGKDGSTTTSWLPWLAENLEEHGLTCACPAFPAEPHSKLGSWFEVLRAFENQDLSTTAFIAHARGAMAVLRWIQNLPKNTHIYQVITVACNADYQPKRHGSDEFYSSSLDYTDLNQKCAHITVIHSADDPYVPITAGRELAVHLHAKFVEFETAGHFGASKTQAPEILAEVLL